MATVQQQLTALRSADSALGGRIAVLEDQVKAILAAGGGGGTTPIPNEPPPADPPTTEPTGSGVTLPVGTSQSAFLTAVANLSYDYILLAGGDYPWNMVDINVDRTANPLLIQPVAGQRVRFPGPGSATWGIFRFGPTATAKAITFDGRVADGFLFDGITLTQSGVWGIFGSDGVTLRNLTFRNLKRGGTATGPQHSWAAYISAPYGRTNTNLVIDRWTLEAPAVNRDVSAIQVASSGSHGVIDITNLVASGYYIAFWGGQPITDLTLDAWTLTNMGAIRIRSVAIDGSYSNIHATNSDPIENLSTGTFVNGGGNSGI